MMIRGHEYTRHKRYWMIELVIAHAKEKKGRYAVLSPTKATAVSMQRSVLDRLDVADIERQNEDHIDLINGSSILFMYPSKKRLRGLPRRTIIDDIEDPEDI